MQTKYAVYDPSENKYFYFETKDEAIKYFWKAMFNFSYCYFHNTPFSVVEINDDGSESWKSADGSDMENPTLPQEIVDNLTS